MNQGAVKSSPRARHTAAEIEPLLAKISVYEYGADPDPLVAFTELVEDLQGSAEHLKSLEARLLKLLQTDATAAGKEVAFRQLALIGTDTSVPVLAPLLARADTAELARFALAAIPGSSAGAALGAGLASAPNDRIRTGIVCSLGERRDQTAVPQLANLISASNPEVSVAAVAALANIANRVALDALSAARQKAGALQYAVSEGYLVCADRMCERGDKTTAIPVYKRMLAPGEPATLRIRALTGLTAADRKVALPLLTAETESKNHEVQAAAIKLLNAIPGAEITKVMVSKFPKLSPVGQVQMLSALATRGDRAAKPLVLTAVKSDSPAVRAAALAALGRLGDESSVTVLAEAAASGQTPEQAAARRSLYSLRGPSIDRALIAAMGSSTGKARIELITAAGERGATSSADALATAAQESDPEARRAALLALRNVGGAGQTAALLDLLLKASSTSERRVITQTLGTVLKRAQPASIGAVISAYNASSNLNSRLSLLEVMGQTSNEEALPLLRASIRDSNPEIARGAILALTAWDNSTPLMDLLNYAKAAPPNLEAAPADPAAPVRRRRGEAQATNNLQVLALRGVLKLILLEPRRQLAESGRLLAEAMDLASQNPEKFTILSLLASFPCQESLEVARAAQRDVAVANEAKVAFAQVTEALRLI